LKPLSSLSHDLPGVTLTLNVSSSVNAASVRELLTQADSALYQGKRRGGNEIVTSAAVV
jgi:PleD family two-component response regulator